MNFVTLCCFCHGERWAWMNHVTICMPLHEAEDQRWQFEALRAESMLRAYLRPNEDLSLLCPCRETTLFCLSNQHRLTGHAKRYSSITWSLCSVPALAMEIACFGDREDHGHVHTKKQPRKEDAGCHKQCNEEDLLSRILQVPTQSPTAETAGSATHC